MYHFAKLQKSNCTEILCMYVHVHIRMYMYIKMYMCVPVYSITFIDSRMAAHSFLSCLLFFVWAILIPLHIEIMHVHKVVRSMYMYM